MQTTEQLFDEIEQVKPTVEQMLVLQAAVVVLAKRDEKIKESRMADRAHVLVPRGVEGFNVDVESDFEHHWQHRFTGRVARTGPRKWSMRIVEAYWEHFGDPKDNDGYRAEHCFEWDRDAVTKATTRFNTRSLADGIRRNAEGSPTMSRRQIRRSIRKDPRYYQIQAMIREQDKLTVCTTASRRQRGNGEEQPSRRPYSEEFLLAVRSFAAVTQPECWGLVDRIQKFGDASTDMQFESVGVKAYLDHDHLFRYDEQGSTQAEDA